MLDWIVTWFLRILLLFSMAFAVEADKDVSIMENKTKLVIVLTSLLLVLTPEAFESEKKRKKLRPH